MDGAIALLAGVAALLGIFVTWYVLTGKPQ